MPAAEINGVWGPGEQTNGPGKGHPNWTLVWLGGNWYNDLKVNLKAKQSLPDIFSYSQRTMLTR